MLLTKRHGRICTVYAAGTGIGQMWCFRIAASFNNIGKANNIAFYITHSDFQMSSARLLVQPSESHGQTGVVESIDQLLFYRQDWLE